MRKLITLFFINICIFCFALFLPALTQAATTSNTLATINNIRMSSSANTVRIVADADKEVDYETFALTNPSRIVIDLKGAQLGSSVQKSFSVSNTAVSGIRIAQYSADTVRIVATSTLTHDAYDIFSLSSGSVPYRVVMDFGKRTTVSNPVAAPSSPAVSPTKPAPTAAAPSTGINIPTFTSPGIKGKKIAIDPGHGGNDSGAIGPKGTAEKDATLRIAMRLKALLENAGAIVIMTRTTDTSIASPTASDSAELQARCDVANSANADIFISIHNDSFTDRSAAGTTSYYYEKGDNSSHLADLLQQGIIEQVHTYNRGTKTANFYVIKHTNMPAVLVETAFISNPDEEALLASSDDAGRFAVGLYNGINKYFAGQ